MDKKEQEGEQRFPINVEDAFPIADRDGDELRRLDALDVNESTNPPPS